MPVRRLLQRRFCLMSCLNCLVANSAITSILSRCRFGIGLSFPDGSRFDYGGTADDTLAEIERLSPEDQAGYRQLLKKSEDIYKLGFEQLSAKPFHRLSTMLAQIPAMLKLGHIARFGSWFRGASKTGDYDVPFPFNRCWSVVTPSIPPASTI